MPDVNKFSADSTIYTYKLAKKIVLGPLFQSLHLALLLAFEVFQLVRFGVTAISQSVIAVVLVLALHRIIASLFLRQTRTAESVTWRMSWRYPLLVILPAGYVGWGSWKRLFTNLFLGGLFIIALGYVWCPAQLEQQIAFFHVWLLLPFIRVWLSFRRIQKPGLLKWQPAECSYYFS